MFLQANGGTMMRHRRAVGIIKAWEYRKQIEIAQDPTQRQHELYANWRQPARQAASKNVYKLLYEKESHERILRAQAKANGNNDYATDNSDNWLQLVNDTVEASKPEARLMRINPEDKIGSDVLDDLACRFIINTPEDLSDTMRLCYHTETAHWFYLDFLCQAENNPLPVVTFRIFSMQLFNHIHYLKKHVQNVEDIIQSWKLYKSQIPKCGAILISESLDYCLLVQSFSNRYAWGFPRGKMNEAEGEIDCAKREVYEETGYDISGKVNPIHYLDRTGLFNITRLYLILNVKLDEPFEPCTRNEIRACTWFRIRDLPHYKHDYYTKERLNMSPHRFYMIMPFLRRLRQFIAAQRRDRMAQRNADAVVSARAMHDHRQQDGAQVMNNSHSTSTYSRSRCFYNKQQRRQYPM